MAPRPADEVEAVAREQYLESTHRLDARIGLHARFSTAERDWPLWVFDQLPIQPGDTVVEIGAGTGALWVSNRDRLPDDVRLVLSDASPAMCHALADTEVGAQVLRCDAQLLPLRDGSANLVVACHMLYHVPDPDRALAEAARVLRPGGQVVVTTNGTGHLRQLEELMAELGVTDAGARMDLPFRLEDAPARIARHFTDVRVVTYPSSLRVTEVQPVVDYVASFVALESQLRQRLETVVESRIARDGALVVDKVVGLVAGRR